MRKKPRSKKLSLHKQTLRHLDPSLFGGLVGALDEEVDTHGCWTCKRRSVCCKSQEPCHDSYPKVDVV